MPDDGLTILFAILCQAPLAVGLCGGREAALRWFLLPARLVEGGPAGRGPRALTIDYAVVAVLAASASVWLLSGRPDGWTRAVGWGCAGVAVCGAVALTGNLRPAGGKAIDPPRFWAPLTTRIVRSPALFAIYAGTWSIVGLILLLVTVF